MNLDTTNPPPKLLIKGLGKRYGDITALEPTDLVVNTGEFVTLLGPSGSGKTTMLQMISGLTEPTCGQLQVDGRDETTTPVHRRDMGLVFQHYALFPHMTVSENIAFPLKMRGFDAAKIRERVIETLAKVQLDAYGDRFPRELSGGQQQRVALARCFVYRPQVVLMDEPLGALDKNLREHMQFEIKRLHREFGTTVIYVTHDQEEALVLSDRICLMNHARVEQIGTPREIYSRPKSIFSAKFIGLSNLFEGEVSDAGNGRIVVSNPNGKFEAKAENCGPLVNGHATLVLRPEHLRPGPAGRGQNSITGKVSEIIYVGSDTRLVLSLDDGETVSVRHDPTADLPEMGASMTYHWPVDVAVFVS